MTRNLYHRNDLFGSSEKAYLCSPKSNDYDKSRNSKRGIKENRCRGYYNAGGVEGFMEVLKGSMAKDQNIYFRGFGAFEMKEGAEKTARNIIKNTRMMIPAHRVPLFKPCDSFKNQVR